MKQCGNRRNNEFSRLTAVPTSFSGAAMGETTREFGEQHMRKKSIFQKKKNEPKIKKKAYKMIGRNIGIEHLADILHI